MTQEHLELNIEGRIVRGYFCYNKLKSPLVIMFHGFTGHKNENAYLFKNYSEILSEEGIASLRMDFSGNGDSDGKFSDMTFNSLMTEAKAIIAYARKNITAEIILLGFSMGGLIVSEIIKEDFAFQKIILWSPAGNLSTIVSNIFKNAFKLQNGNADLGGLEVGMQFLEELDNLLVYQGLDKFSKEVFIVHGEKDLSVNLSYGLRYAKEIKNSEIEIISEANHVYGTQKHRKLLYSKSTEFIKSE